MDDKNEKFYMIINGMDLTGKTTLADSIRQDCKNEDVKILRSSFSDDNPLNQLASRLRMERERGEYDQATIKELYDFARREDLVLYDLLRKQQPIISDEAIGHLYADATDKELKLFNPTTNIIHDSSTIIKTLTIHKDLGSNKGLIKKLERLRQNHPQPTKPNYSILLEASIEAKMDRLKMRMEKGGFISELDRKILIEPCKIQRQAEIMKNIILDTFPSTMILDTTKMSKKEVLNEVENHLDIFNKGRDL